MCCSIDILTFVALKYAIYYKVALAFLLTRLFKPFVYRVQEQLGSLFEAPQWQDLAVKVIGFIHFFVKKTCKNGENVIKWGSVVELVTLLTPLNLHMKKRTKSNTVTGGGAEYDLFFH